MVADTGCKYINSLAFDDQVLIKTKVTEKKKVSLRFEYEVLNKKTNEKIAEAWTKGKCRTKARTK